MQVKTIAYGVAFVAAIYSLGIVKADDSSPLTPPDAPARAAYILKSYAAVYRVGVDGKPIPEWLDNELAAMVQVGNARLIKGDDGEFYAPRKRGGK